MSPWTYATTADHTQTEMIEFEIRAMNDSRCVAAIAQVLTALDPGAKLQAEVPTRRLRIQTRLPRAAVERALRVAGYAATPVL